MEEFIPVLREFGLEESEAKVYLAGLVLGSSTANEISYKAELLRTTTYEILKRLLGKGLASVHEQDNIKYFEMIEPQELLRLVEDKAKRLQESLPMLKKIKETAGKRPKAEVFSGYKGIKNLLDLQLESRQDIFILGKIENSNKFLGPYREQYIRRRVRYGAKMHVICEPSAGAEEFKEKDKESLRITRTADFCKDLPATITFFEEKVAIITFLKEDPVGVLIHNKNIQKTFLTMFKEFEKHSK